MIDNNVRLEKIRKEIQRSIHNKDWIKVGMLKAEEKKLLWNQQNKQGDKTVEYLKNMFGFNK